MSDVYVEMEKELTEKGELYRVDYAKTEVDYYRFNQHITHIIFYTLTDS